MLTDLKTRSMVTSPASGMPAAPTDATTAINAITICCTSSRCIPVAWGDKERGHRFVESRAVVIEVTANQCAHARRIRPHPYFVFSSEDIIGNGHGDG